MNDTAGLSEYWFTQNIPSNISVKKSLKILKGLSEAVNYTIKKKSYHVFHKLYFSKKPIIIALIKISRRYLLNSPNIILVGIVLLKPRTDECKGQKKKDKQHLHNTAHRKLKIKKHKTR
jgi:hypothetical protein